MNHYLNELEKARRDMDENGMGNENDDNNDMQAAFWLVISISSLLIFTAGFFIGRLSCVA